MGKNTNELTRRIAELEREIDGANTDRVAALNRATSAEIRCGALERERAALAAALESAMDDARGIARHIQNRTSPWDRIGLLLTSYSEDKLQGILDAHDEKVAAPFRMLKKRLMDELGFDLVDDWARKVSDGAHDLPTGIGEWLAAHDEQTCRPLEDKIVELVSALDAIHANCVAGSADPRSGVARSSVIRIGEICEEQDYAPRLAAHDEALTERVLARVMEIMPKLQQPEGANLISTGFNSAVRAMRNALERKFAKQGVS